MLPLSECDALALRPVGGCGPPSSRRPVPAPSSGGWPSTSPPPCGRRCPPRTPGKGVILSPPSGRPRLSVLAVPAGISRPTGVLDLDEVAPGIWLRTVEVREAVLLCQATARKREAGAAP